MRKITLVARVCSLTAVRVFSSQEFDALFGLKASLSSICTRDETQSLLKSRSATSVIRSGHNPLNRACSV